MIRLTDLNKLVHFIAQPWVLALLFSIVFFPFVPRFDKYLVAEVDSGSKNPTATYIYEDLNQDGKSEKVVVQNNPQSTVSIIVYEDSKLIDQWNYSGIFVNNPSVFFGDYDSNGVKEI